MPQVTDETSIKLFTDNAGHVWYSSGVAPPRNSKQPIDVFLLSPVIAGMGLRFRILGLAQNAELLTALYLRRRKSEVAAIEIAGPNICNSRDELNDPPLVFRRMRSATTAAACGGWRLMVDWDYLMYALVARMTRNHGTLDNIARAYLLEHPAYRALTVIPTLSEIHVAQLFKTIIDPRWFVDQRAPDRQGKLELFMGLTPKTQKRVSDATRLLHKPRELRCSLVLDCWKSSHAGAVNLEDPQNFLYRIHARAGGGSRGDLRGSQAFLRYVRCTWLDAVDTRKGPHDGLFAPELFFKTDGEILAYRQHMSRT